MNENVRLSYSMPENKIISMKIIVEEVDSETIDIKDLHGIKLMTLSMEDSKGLYLYFKVKLEENDK